MPSKCLKFLCGNSRQHADDSLNLFSSRENINYCRLFWWHYSLVRVVWLNQQRLCDACLVSSDTIQISVNPSLLNKHMCLGTRRLILPPLNSGISLSLTARYRGLWVMGGNHFPCLLNKTIKRHYELASGRAFVCHCLHLFKGVSGLSCFFWLFQNIINLPQREISGNAEADSDEEPAVTLDDTYQTVWPTWFNKAFKMFLILFFFKKESE